MTKINIGIKIGDNFGNLTVVRQGKRCDSYICQCKCGKEVTFGQAVLVTKHNTNCGDAACNTTIVHGLTRTNFYRHWDSINKRCTNPKYGHYHRYGGRGIKSDWVKNFLKFRDEMYESYISHYEKYGKDTEIDRIDVNGNYCKENCRWVTKEEQANNRSTSRFINYKGEKMTLTQLARKLGVGRIKLHNSLRYRKEEDLLKLIESGSIYKKSNGKKLELL